MNLDDLKNGTATTKPWLNIVANSITVDTLTANNVTSPPTTAYVSMITDNTYSGAQPAANLLVGLSPNSRLTIPANSMAIGDVYRLEFNAVVNAANPGDSATFDLACTSGPLTYFPNIAPAAFVDVPMVGVCDITLASPNTVNVQTTISGFMGTPLPTSAGFSFFQGGIPFDSSVTQALTFRYTTANFTSMQITKQLLYRLASGSS